MIEVELRGFLTEDEFKLKLKELQTISTSFEEDHRDTVFFMLSKATLKVTHMKSKKQAKIAYKAGDINSTTGQDEIEISIPVEEYENTIILFQNLGFTNKQITSQIRYNLKIDNFEVSMKWSRDWGHHFEVEKMVAEPSLVNQAFVDVKEFCMQNGLKVMDTNEFEKFRQRVDAEHRQTLY